MSEDPDLRSTRKQISDDLIAETMHLVMGRMQERLQEKGRGSFVSIHEISGIVLEEHTEIQDAVHLNDHGLLYSELEDMAVACIFSLASLRGGGLHW